MSDMDKQARERITTATDKNIFVEAGAGSGKTTQLVERMAALIGKGADISTICAITFTKAAAREFYGRFQVRLAELEETANDENVKANYRKALDNIDLCFMGTIDAFSELILREHPITAGIPSDFSTGAENDLDHIYNDAWNKIVSYRCSDEVYDKYIRFINVCEKPKYYFVTVAKNLSGRKDSDIRIPDYEKDINKAFAGIKKQLTELLECLISHPEYAYVGNGRNKAANLQILDDYTAALPKLKGSWSESLNDIENIVSSFKNYVLTCEPSTIGIKRSDLFKMSDRPKGAYRLDLSGLGLHEMIREYTYCLTLDLVVPALKMITEDCISTGELSFLDAKILLRDMLKNDAANGGRLIRHIRERHGIFLADEFQDTDPVQTQILFYLTAKEPDPDVSKCEPAPGTLFIVGDPKQSIYRFRGADIASFIRTRTRFENGIGEVLKLTRNFRSTNKLKGEFNRLFTELLDKDTDIQSRFEVIPIEGSDDSKVMTGFYSYSTSKETDCIKVAEIIHSLINDSRRFVKDQETKEIRRIKYKDIMVITPGKKIIGDLLTELKMQGIPCYAEGGSVLEKCPSFLEICKVFKALACPDDTVALAAVVKGECFGIDERELSAFLPDISLVRFKPTGYRRIDDAFDTLCRLYKASNNVLPSVLYGMITEELKLLTHISADDLESLYYARELLRSGESDGSVCSIKAACELLYSFSNNDKKERSLRFEPAQNSVKIANLHKVKGLEANIVILAAPDMSEHSPEVTTIRTDTSAQTFVFDCKKCAVTNTYFRDEYNDEARAGVAEKERLIYVAATRARSVLLVAKPYQGSNYWSFLSNRAEEEYEYETPDHSDTDKPSLNVSNIYDTHTDLFAKCVSKQSSYTLILPSKLSHDTKISANAKAENGEDSRAQDQPPIKRNAALIGTLVHRLMERLVTVRFNAERSSTVNAVLSDIGADESYALILEKVFDTVMNGGYVQKNNAPADIKTELSDAQTMCEVPFCYKRKSGEGEELCNGVIDLIYQKNGKLCIVDYKTTAETENLEESYSSQLDEYKAAVKTILGESADAYIYHIDV